MVNHEDADERVEVDIETIRKMVEEEERQKKEAQYRERLCEAVKYAGRDLRQLFGLKPMDVWEPLMRNSRRVAHQAVYEKEHVGQLLHNQVLYMIFNEVFSMPLDKAIREVRTQIKGEVLKRGQEGKPVEWNYPLPLRLKLWRMLGYGKKD